MTEKIIFIADDGDDITFWDEHFKKLNIESPNLADETFYVKIDTEKAYNWFNNFLSEEGYETLDKCVSHRPKLTGLYFYDAYRDIWKQLEGELNDLYYIMEFCGITP